MPANAIHKAFQRLWRWIRRQTGIERPTPPGTLEGIADRATLWRIPSNEPGVCACWWLCHQDAGADLVISILSLAQLKQDLAAGHGYRRATDPVRVGHPFADDLHAYLEAQGGLDARFISHIFIIAWRSRIPQSTRNGERRAYLCRPLGAFPCDIQGSTSAWGNGDRYALRITEMIARRLLKLNPTLNSWEAIVGGIDWLDWLDAYAKKYLGQSHTLQPRKH